MDIVRWIMHCQRYVPNGSQGATISLLMVCKEAHLFNHQKHEQRFNKGIFPIYNKKKIINLYSIVSCLQDALI